MNGQEAKSSMLDKIKNVANYRWFVSIASYCDPQLVPTINDLLAKATHPEWMRIVVCFQHMPDETLDGLAAGSPTVIDVPYMEAKGCCWARKQTQQHYNGEAFYLQLDSHHRFAQGWDVTLLQQWADAPSLRPVISGYVAPYEIADDGTDKLWEPIPQSMMLTRITSDGVLLFRGGLCPEWPQTKAMPVRARFVSGHFLFAPGSWIETVPSDDRVYFTGEEIMLPVRGWTHGYDLYHPTKHILWHEYTRKQRPKHWDHHQFWHVQSKASEDFVRDQLLNRPIGQYDFGTARTVESYEAYTGISFKNWTAEPPAWRGEEPNLP